MPPQINVADFDLAATLESGQAFRWRREPDGGYVGVIGRQVFRLRQDGATLAWQAAGSAPQPPPRVPDKTCSRRLQPAFFRTHPEGCGYSKTVLSGAPSSGAPDPAVVLRHYLALDRSLPAIVATFPDDPPLEAAVKRHWGLRVLRQEPWECLASFIASSTKQIVQIRQIVAHLARRFGEPLAGGHYSFPAAAVLARASHQQLRDCKLGFRAGYLLAAAQRIDCGRLDLDALRRQEFGRALEELQQLAGVGEKIASCALLFSLGFDQAFPIDVWIERALRRLYFPHRRISARQLREFARAHFGPQAGWAQQYLFFQERQRGRAPAQRRG